MIADKNTIAIIAMTCARSMMIMSRIVDNNLSNAIKYANKNTDIEVRLKKEDELIVLEFLTYAKRINAIITGPGSFGIISPGKAVLGWIGGSIELANEAFKPGIVGVISRSGGQTTTISWLISKSGFGVSTAIHVGAEPIVGMTEAELVKLFNEDPETQAIVIFGEIGGVQEEEVAQLVEEEKIAKPIVAYIAGRTLPSGVRYSHASAVIIGEKGSAKSKIEALRRVGVKVVENISDIPKAISEVLRR